MTVTSSLTDFGGTRSSHRACWAFGLLAPVAACLFIAELTIGSVAIPIANVLQIVFTGEGNSIVQTNIVWEFRLPRTLNAVLSGAALGAAGVILQTLFRNPLADPYILGIVHGARLGAAILVVGTGLAGNAFLLKFGLIGDIGLALASVMGCVALLAILSFLSTRVSIVVLLLSGLMLGYLAIGLINVLMHFVDENHAKAFKAWDDASFAGATWDHLKLMGPSIFLGLAVCTLITKPLNSMLLGDRYAASLGVAVGRVRLVLLLLVGWFCGIVTAFSGPVAFLGLVSAQVARGILGTSDHRILIPYAALVGSTFALAADLVAHLPLEHHVFHLNAVIGLVGAPIALFVLLRSRSLRSWES